VENAVTWIFDAVRLVSGGLAFFGIRAAYVVFFASSVLYFPVRTGFHLNPQPCEAWVTGSLALYSLTNVPHILLFTVFFVMSSAQLSGRWRLAFAAAATLAMGVFVELGEGLTATGHCRLRDLIPDSAGALIGAALVIGWERIRIGRPRIGAMRGW